MNRGQPQQPFPQASDFLKQTNYDAILNYTRKSITDSYGELTDKTDKRLQGVLNHYMKEVAKQNPGKKVQELNRETIRETLTSMEGWLRRGGESTPTTSEIYRQPESTDRLYSNVGAQLINQQKERSLVMNAPAIKPDFRDKVEEDVIDPMQLFEKARLAREKEGMMKPAVSKPDLVLRDDSPEYKVPQNLPQDVIIRQQDVTKYKEVEYNIFLNSGDRNWIQNTSENRYEFSINFNVANNTNTFPMSPSVQERFRNIVRIETVKVVVPLESLDTIVQVASALSYSSAPVVSVLSYQYVALRIAELNTNGFGTNSKLDNSFAIMHQDTQWVSDSSTASANRGFASLTPKYLKCQKIYAPTPLGSLQKLSIRIENPTGNTLSAVSDVQKIQQIVFSSDLQTFTGNNSQSTLYITAPGTEATPGTATSTTTTTNEYIFIQCSTWFSKWQLNYPDKIVISNFVVGGTSTLASVDFTNFITRAEGHYVVGLAYSGGTAGTTVTDGQNANGFSNWVIIRNRFNDPTLTSSYNYPSGITVPYLSRQYFGGTAATEIALGIQLYGASSTQTSIGSSAALLNLNHQTHVVLRIVTREMDGASNLRPDNTN